MRVLVRLLLVVAGAMVAGAALSGCGGPDMGTMTVTPASIVAKAPVSLHFTYTAPATASSGLVQVVVPAGWTAPEATSSTGKGYTSALPSTCTSASVSAIAGGASGPWTITVAVDCPASGQFALIYGGAGAAAVRSPTMVGPVTFATSAEFGGATSFTALATSPSVQVTTNIGSVTLSLSPASLAAGDGFTTATMRVTDLAGQPLAGRPPALTGSSGQTFGSVNDGGDGTYTARVWPSSTGGTATLTATDLGVQASATLTQVPVGSITFPSPLPTFTVGRWQTLVVSVRDPDGIGIPGAALTTVVTGSVQYGGVSDNGDGTYAISLLAAQTPGSAAVSVYVGPASGTTSFAVRTGPPASAAFYADDPTLPANGSAYATLGLVVYDQYGNTLTPSGVTITSNGDATISPVVLGTNRSFHATATASTTLGDQLITAGVGSVHIALYLHLIDPVPHAAATTLVHPMLAPDGVSTAVASVTVTNAEGQGLVQQPVTVTDDGGLPVSAVVSDNAGTYTAVVGPAGSAARVTVTGADGTVASTATLTVTNPTLVWQAAGSMSTARMDHTATLLPDGDVLVAGGYRSTVSTLGGPQNGTQPLASVELYHPSTNTWSNAAPMATARADHTATLLASGKVLVTGGYGSAGVLTSTELYDPASNTWSARAALPAGRWGQTATLLLNGKVFVFGGSNTSSSNTPIAAGEFYDPVANTWTATSPIGPIGHLADGTIFHTATRLLDGRVLIAGTDSSSLYPAIYDPTFDRWDYIESGLSGVSFPATPQSVLLDSGRALMEGLGHADLVTPAPGQAQQVTPIETRPNATLVDTLVKLPDGRVLAVGGDDVQSSGNSLIDVPVASAEVYDPVSSVWAPDTPMLSARARHTATVLPDGSVLVVGGANASGVLASAERTTLVTPAPQRLTATVGRALLPADGTTSTTVTLGVSAPGGTPLAGQPVSLSLSGPGTLGPLTDLGNGSYTATYTASTTAGSAWITVVDGSVSRQIGLVDQPGPPASMSIQATPDPVHVSGQTRPQVVISVSLLDAQGNVVEGGGLSVAVSGDATLAAWIIEDVPGLYLIGYGPSTTIGDQTVTLSVTASGAHVVGTVVIHQIA